MPVVNLEILREESFANGQAFGDVGAYKRIEAIAHYEVDPNHTANAGITDLGLAPLNDNGRVTFSGDVSLLLPEDLTRANGSLLIEVPNRGNRILPRSFNQAPFLLTPSDEINPGDGFLMRDGWCIAWVGWQWDMPKCAERLGLDAPLVAPEKLGTRTQMHLRIQPNREEMTFTLTDHHVGSIGSHAPIPPDRADDPDAVLMVRDHFLDTPSTLARETWRFVGDGPDRVELDGGFRAGQIYDLLYTPRECRVGACGMLAIRDFASFGVHDPNSPFAGGVSHAIGEGISQCGRFLRTMIHQGLNIDESGRQVFAGILAHIAGGRRGEFNQRYSQPSVQPTPAFGHLFPFTDEAQTNPQTGETAGLLDTLRARDIMPKVMYTDTSSEYWRGDAGLAHTHLADDTDMEPPADVRRYLFCSTQHGPGLLPYADASVFGSHGANLFNAVDYRPLFRAALVNLRQWITDGTEPPPSAFPRRADGTGTTREDVMQKLESINHLALPREDRLPWLYPLDFGPRADEWVGTYPAKVVGHAYKTVVSDVDDAGNETGGLRMPDVTIPVATHTGFNPRQQESGGDGQLLEYVGSTLPRQELLARYADRDSYLARIRADAESLVGQRIILAEDIELCVTIAGERYDAAVEKLKSTT